MTDTDTPAQPSPQPAGLTESERREALEVARRLAALGVPVFVAPPDPKSTTGFALPTDWQHTAPDPAVVDTWRPGWALCAVMGAGLDLLDVDPRNGGLEALAAMNGTLPRAYATAATPSGGWHHLIASLGVGSRDNTHPGIDVKGGLPDERSRGFAFLAPTEKPSKDPATLGQVRPYRWVTESLDWAGLEALLLEHETDFSGRALADRVTELRRFVATPRALPQVGGLLGEWARQKEPQRFDAAERAIDQKLADIRDWDPAGDFGGRQTVLRAALTLGGYVGGGYLEEDEAVERLLDACAQRWGAANEEDRLWITQGVTDGQRSPFRVYTREQELEFDAEQRAAQDAYAAQVARRDAEALYGAPGVVPDPDVGGPSGTHTAPDTHHPGEGPQGPVQVQGPPIDPPAGPPPITRWIGDHPFDPDDCSTDQQLAEAVADRVRCALRYATDAGVWLERSPERWIERKKADSMDTWAVSEVARLMPLGQTPVPKEVGDRTPEHWKAVRWRDFQMNAPANRIAAKLRSRVAGSGHPSSLRLTDLDADPEVLWAGGMPWDLRASAEVPTLAGVDPNQPHLHSALCAPQPVETPAWDAYLATVWPDPEIRSWAVRLLSVGFSGYPDAVIPMLFGPSRSGKSSVVGFLTRVLGTYGIAANPKLLSANDSSHDAIVYQLKGARLAFIDEGPRSGHLAGERLKQLTGGAQLTAAQKGANPIVFEPTHTLVMTSNEPPPLTDPALRQRLRIIPCDATQAQTYEAWRRLVPADTWAREAPGILAKMMVECARWLADRASVSQDSAPLGWRSDLADLEAEENPLHTWVELCTVPSEPGTKVSALYDAYLAWHDQQLRMRRVAPVSQTTFGTTLTELGYPGSVRKEGGKACRFRPLSVLGGGGYAPPQMTPPGMVNNPPGTPHTGPSTPPPPPLNWHGGDNVTQVTSPEPMSQLCEPCESSILVTAEHVTPGPVVTPPVTLENHRSDPLSSSSSYGLQVGESIENGEHITNTNGVTQNIREQIGKTGVTRVSSNPTPPDTGSDLRKQGGNGSDTPPSDPEAVLAGLPEGFDPLANITARQKKLISEATGWEPAQAGEWLKAYKARHKAGLRRQEKQDKISFASGPETPLPVAVNRALEVSPLDPGEVLALGRAVLARSEGVLTVDMENTGFPVGHRHYALRTVQLGDDGLALVLDPQASAEAIRALLAEARVLVAHSGQADLVALAHDGLCDFDEAMTRLSDTAIRARLSDPKVTGPDGDLKRVAPAVLGAHAVTPTTEAARKALFGAGGWLEDTKVDADPGRSGWAQASPTGETMQRYAAGDVLDTHAIGRAIPPIPDWLDARERVVHQMTARITYRGVPLDHEHIRALEARHAPERARLTDEIRAFPGTAIDNPGSPKQLAEAFQLGLGVSLPKTKPDRLGRGGGSPCTAEHVLQVLAKERAGHAEGELARLVLDWRGHKTALDTFISPYRALCEMGDGRARPTIYTVGTNTGRTSCVRPNAQQLPRQDGFRAMYGADPGYVIVRADFSSVEIRGAGALSGDTTLLESIRASDALGADSKADLHWVVARQAYGPEAGKEDRYRVKPAVFARLYGGGAATIAEQLGRSEREVAVIIDSLDAVTPQYRSWAKGLIGEAKAGRRAFEAYSGRLVWFTQPSSAPNYAVQGSCRELLVDALLRWRETRWGGCMVLPVHDELLVWVPAEDAHEATQELVRCMTSSLTGLATVPIKAEPDKPDEVTGRWHGFTRWPDAS